MKSRLIIVLLGILMIMGCSYDQIDDPLIEEALSDMKISDDTMVVTPIRFIENGKFKVVPSKDCSSLEMYYLSGNFRTSIWGQVKTRTYLCTDNIKENTLNGVMWLESGSKIFYESELTEEDSKGPYYVYIINGGTGLYENATGKFNVYFGRVHENKIMGSYRHAAEGFISNMKQP